MKPDTTSYRPQLDGIRAICILFTVVWHVPVRPSWINGSLGVDVFFALSGWLITTLLIQEQARNGTISLRSFYIRRVFRIAPLYYVTFMLYAAAALVLARAGRTGDWSDLTAAAPYLLTFNSEYRGLEGGNIFGHAWTLGIEEKFYLFWPAILLVSGRRIGVAAALVCACIALLMLPAPDMAGLWRGYFGLGFGAALSIFVHRHERLRLWLAARPIAGLFALAMLVPYGLWLAGLVGVACNLIIAALAGVAIASLWFREAQPLARLLGWRPLAWLGRLTYAIYLIQTLAINVAERILPKLHVPVDAFVPMFVTSYAISVAGAYALHKLVEKPLIEVGRSFARTWSRPAAAARSTAAGNWSQ